MVLLLGVVVVGSEVSKFVVGWANAVALHLRTMENRSQSSLSMGVSMN